MHRAGRCASKFTPNPDVTCVAGRIYYRSISNTYRVGRYFASVMSRSKGPAAGIAVRSPGDRRVRMSTVACTVGEKREVVGQTGEVPAPEEGRVLAA